MKIVDLSPTLPHATTPPCVQMQITPVSFASTTQVRTDVPVPPTVNQMVPPTQELRVPLLQITSVASTLNTQTPSQTQEQNTEPCRKCGRKNHKTDKCRKKVACKNCRKKDHSTKFCTVTPYRRISAHIVERENIQQRTVELGKRLRRKQSQQEQWPLQMTC